MTEPALRLQALNEPSDASALELLYTGSLGPSLRFLKSLLKQPTCHAWSLWQGEQVIGAIWYQRVAGKAEVLDLCVLPSLRRQGYGRRLLESSLKTLAPVDGVDLEVRASNEAAQGLYRALGFTETGRRPNYYVTPEGREDAILMSWEPQQA